MCERCKVFVGCNVHAAYKYFCFHNLLNTAMYLSMFFFSRFHSWRAIFSVRSCLHFGYHIFIRYLLLYVSLFIVYASTQNEVHACSTVVSIDCYSVQTVLRIWQPNHEWWSMRRVAPTWRKLAASGVVWLPWQRDNERSEQDGRRRLCYWLSVM